MAPNPGIPVSDGFAWRLSAFYAAFFIYGGITLPFMPAWLASRGLDARQIGLMLAVPLAVRLIVVPFATRLADRFAILRPAIFLTSLASVAGLSLLGVSSGFVAILAAMALASVFLTPIMPLADAYGLRGLPQPRRSYGPVRLWGSVTFVVANLGGGVILNIAGAGNLVWTLVAAQLATAACAAMLRPLAEPQFASRRIAAGASLWTLPAFVAVVVATSLIQASHAVLYGFATIQWTARGLDGTAVGVLWSIGVIAEIILFALAGRVVAAVGAIGLIVLGGAGAVLRWTTMALDPPSVVLPALQILHALSFGATHLGAMTFLSDVAGERHGATAQGDCAAVQAAVFAGAMALSGNLVESYGLAAYAAMAVAAGLGLVVAIAGRRRWIDADRP